MKSFAAFTEEEIANLDKTRKPAPRKKAPAPAEPSMEGETPVREKRAFPDGIHAVRGMSLRINEMLAEGCYTPDEIIKCILPMTKDGLERQAVTKLKSHLQNMKKNGANIFVMEDKYIACADVILPDME